jgi:2-acylglycerol O-acyltransferase 2
MSIGHLLTFTNGCGFLDMYNGERRDLAATGLFYIPILRDLCIYLGCVDASKKTATYNLKKGRSILIFVGGEKEQLMTKEHEHKIFLKNRKGFVKLALEYNCKLVPMYCYGENEAYVNSHFCMSFRKWLQRTFQIGLPIVFHFLPKKVGLHLEIGKPIEFTRKSNSAITDQEINEYHDEFCKSIEDLFNKTPWNYLFYFLSRIIIFNFLRLVFVL